MEQDPFSPDGFYVLQADSRLAVAKERGKPTHHHWGLNVPSASAREKARNQYSYLARACAAAIFPRSSTVSHKK